MIKLSNLQSPVKHHVTLLISALLIGVTSGCADRIAVAERDMTDIRNSKSQPIEPPPTPKLVEDFVYSANKERSPFMPPSLLNQQVVNQDDNGVKPDLTREKEPLEDYELSELTYRGVIVAPSGEEFGLVQRPDGIVTNVKIGDYIGANDGRIVEITPTQINLIQIVPDSSSGFVEKPESLVSPIS